MTRNTIISILEILLPFAILAIIVWGLLLVLPSAAHADGWEHPWSLSPSYARPRKHRSKYRNKPNVNYYAAPKWVEEIEDDGNKRPICLRSYVKIVSTEHTNKANAMEAAKKMWAAAAQWEEGSQYMSLDLAEDYREHCGPSNAMDTMSGRISEATNKLIGQEGQNLRCVIRARPCRAVMQKAEGHK